MPLIITKNDTSPIMLSVTIKNGHYGTTTITLNGNAIKTIDGNFTECIVGTNNGLKNNSIAVVTMVLVTNDQKNTEVDFDLTGAVNPDHYTSKKTAANGVSYVPHYNDYTFI